MFRTKHQIILIAAMLSAVFVFSAGMTYPSTPPDDESALLSILKATGDYCEKIKQLSLHYVCLEKIKTEDIAYWVNYSRSTRAYSYSIRNRERKEYLYDYQLIRKNGRIFEKRDLLEENGKKKNVQDVSLEGIKYVGKFQVFGPVGFFSCDWQPYFDYKLEKKERLFGRKCHVVSATPNHKMKDNRNTARIWVDENSLHILKIDWGPSSIQGYKEEPIRGELGEMRKEVTWSTEYQIENKGIRFPSRQTAREFYIDRKDSKLLRKEIVFQYSDYQFFTVEVDVNIKKENMQ